MFDATYKPKSMASYPSVYANYLAIYKNHSPWCLMQPTNQKVFFAKRWFCDRYRQHLYLCLLLSTAGEEGKLSKIKTVFNNFDVAPTTFVMDQELVLTNTSFETCICCYVIDISAKTYLQNKRETLRLDMIGNNFCRVGKKHHKLRKNEPLSC